MKSIIMTTVKGRRKINVPDDAKVTFGAVCPGGTIRAYDGRVGWCLRVYASQKKNAQVLAAFTDVVDFREDGVKVMERVSQIKRKRVGNQGPNSLRDSVIEAKIESWVDPDDDDDVERDLLLAEFNQE